MAAATVTGVALAGAAIGSAGPDAQILQLGREFDAARAAEKRWFDEVYPSIPVDKQDAAADVQMDVTGAIVAAIISTRAVTIPGLVVKARAVAYCHGDDDVHGLERDLVDESPATDTKLLWSLLADLFAIADARGANV